MSPDADAVAELVASRRDLSAALTQLIDFQVAQMKLTPDQSAAAVRGTAGIPLEDQAADQVSWFDLSALIEGEPERGEALWRRLKADAAKELATGVRASRAIEREAGGRPMDRARFMAVLAGLRESLAPRDALEELLLQQMAGAHDQYLFWLARGADRAQAEVWEGDADRTRAIRNMTAAQRERYELDHGWMPPRVSTAEAVDQAVAIADRFQRSFLRLLKAYRDNRRLFGTLVVAGGQVNIGEQQVNVAAATQPGAGGLPIDPPSPRNRAD